MILKAVFSLMLRPDHVCWVPRMEFYLLFDLVVTVLPCQTCIPWKKGTQRRGLVKPEETSLVPASTTGSLWRGRKFGKSCSFCVTILVSAELCHGVGQGISLWLANAICIWNAIHKAVVLFPAKLLLLRTVWKAQAGTWGNMTIHFYLLSTLSN